MNCYLCSLERGTISQPALGLCHTCGAGMCEYHLISVTLKPVAGMAGMVLPARRLLCSHCHEGTISGFHSPGLHHQRKEQSRWSASIWWKWFIHSRRHALLKPEEAVTLAEHFLKEQWKLSNTSRADQDANEARFQEREETEG